LLYIPIASIGKTIYTYSNETSNRKYSIAQQ